MSNPVGTFGADFFSLKKPRPKSGRSHKRFASLALDALHHTNFGNIQQQSFLPWREVLRVEPVRESAKRCPASLFKKNLAPKNFPPNVGLVFNCGMVLRKGENDV